MQVLRFQLVKEDYQNWIRWNVERTDTRKMKLISLVFYVLFIVVFLGNNIKAAQGNIAAMLPSIFVALVVGAGMMYLVSKHNQERMIWKNSGLLKMERTNSFPNVIVTLEDKGMIMDVPTLNAKKYYSYKSLLSIQEIDRLFLIETAEKTCQFIAKSAFAGREEMDEFVSFIESKIEDAKEHPENYETVKDFDGEVAKTAADSSLSHRAAGSAAAEAEAADEPEIELVDTSRMGKIGRMAHIMAAMDRAETEEAESEPETDLLEAEPECTPQAAASEQEPEAGLQETESETASEPGLQAAAETLPEFREDAGEVRREEAAQ